MEGTITKELIRTNRNLFVVNTLLLGLMISICWANVEYYSVSGGGAIISLFFIAPAFGLFVWNIFNAIRRSFNFSLHPIAKQLSIYGDPAIVGDAIASELRNQYDLVKFPKCTLTANWLIVPHVFGSDFVRLDHIDRIYKHVTKYYLYFIPTGFKEYKAIVLTRLDSKVEIASTHSNVDKILETIRTRAPSIEVGYSE